MVQHEKAILRKEMLDRRNAASPERRKEMSAAIAERLFSEPRVRAAGCIALYMSIGSEVETRGMIERAVKEGKVVLLPVVASDHHLELCRFESFGRMKKGRFGILEPEDRITPGGEPGAVVLPGIAFGLCMHRLGYGRGYYDRLLAHLPSYRIGVCYDFQVVDKLPRHEDDQRMNMIITEKRAIV